VVRGSRDLHRVDEGVSIVAASAKGRAKRVRRHGRCAHRELRGREGAVGSLPMLDDAVGQNADYYGVTKKGRASPS
jgi:hypothetical protein